MEVVIVGAPSPPPASGSSVKQCLYGDGYLLGLGIHAEYKQNTYNSTFMSKGIEQPVAKYAAIMPCN